LDEREGLDSGGDVAIVPKLARKKKNKENKKMKGWSEA
jgi:hypothetical protein